MRSGRLARLPRGGGGWWADPLPSWRQTVAKQSILEFVAATTDPKSLELVPESDRVAVFDNDGTLWAEMPMYAQLAFALDRGRSWAPNHT